ncbi:testis-expressed sequence 26 protein [Platysternon megacephalum]|uniref:Testis-expressed sequence 26 protein n=1 Tax=Platysternon megacephalum TaxID=55544 RepID=A0A4D9EI37_9SAUR|nr:testis-expressed sequence 26 protein [Platysternon megacephalum]
MRNSVIQRQLGGGLTPEAWLPAQDKTDPAVSNSPLPRDQQGKAEPSARRAPPCTLEAVVARGVVATQERWTGSVSPRRALSCSRSPWQWVGECPAGVHAPRAQPPCRLRGLSAAQGPARGCCCLGPKANCQVPQRWVACSPVMARSPPEPIPAISP